MLMNSIKKPEKFIDSTVGVLDIVSKGKIEYVFIHTASYLTGKEAEKLEKMGYWLIQASQYLRDSKKDSGSHRGI
jgi:ADP-dependent phosphofructokinase/glucokinase